MSEDFGFDVLIDPFSGIRRVVDGINSGQISAKGIKQEFFQETSLRFPFGDIMGYQGGVSLSSSTAVVSDNRNALVVGKTSAGRGIHAEGNFSVKGRSRFRRGLTAPADEVRLIENNNVMKILDYIKKTVKEVNDGEA